MDLRKGFVEEVKGIIEDSRVKTIRAVDHVRVKMYCLSPLNDWTDFLIQFRTLNLGNHEYKTSKLEC